MNNLLQFEDFINLLKQLDSALKEKDIFIDIKAIGGFAMIYWAKEYNEDSRRASRDIDSLYKLSDEVQNIIRLIGIKNNVDEKWLNNEWLLIKKENEELEYFADWRSVNEYCFTNLNLYILDVETLFFFKMRAINDRLERSTEPPRQQDVRDVYLIMKIFDEHDIYNIKNNKMASCISYFPCARDYMSGREPVE